MANEKQEQPLDPLEPLGPLERRREHFLRDFFENSELYTFGIITQKGYRDLEDQLSKHAKSVSDRFHRWLVYGLIAFSIIALSSTAALIGFGILLQKQAQVTHDIQLQRASTIRGNCEDQNERNYSTVAKLNKAVAVEIKRHPERKDQIRQSAEVSIGLINALAPHQDCVKVVREATQ
jgi:hypothetical protein